MVGVFAVFATLSMLMFKQFGIGLATAILIDATIVRAVLLPASMKLLGDWNWYLPRWLQWLPRFDLGESEVEAGATPAPAAAPAAAPKPRRRRGRKLIPLGVVIGTAVAVIALSPASLSAGVGNKSERPADSAQLQRSYEYGIGNFTLDLRHVTLPPGTTRVDVKVGIGHVHVRVPEDAALRIDASAAAGKVDVLDETSDGTGVDDRIVSPGATASAPVLALDAEVGFGRLAVSRG
jgi:hypothetical protein